MKGPTLHTPFDYGAVTFGPLAAFVHQKTVKTLCGRRVGMSRVTLNTRDVDCLECVYDEASGMDNTYYLAHVGPYLTQEWRDRFGESCPCNKHRGGAQ